MRHRTLLVASLALACLSVPAPAAAQDLAQIPLARHVCPDGLEVLVSEIHATPLVTVEIAAHEGAMTEDKDYNGLSHLYEHMFFKGNAVLHDQLAFLARLRALGMVFNGTTNTELVNYFFTTTSDHFADSMVFMRDAIEKPLFDPKEFERERVVVTGEIDRNESQPRYHLHHLVNAHVFWKYPTRKDPLGTRSTVLAATPEKMRTIQKRYYVPNNSVLVVTGDVKAEDVFAQADKLYTDWAHADDPFKKFPLPEHPAIRSSEVVLVAQPVTDVDATFAWQGPSTTGPNVHDTYTADLVSALVNDPGSRFQKSLVDSGQCIAAGVGYGTQRHTGTTGVGVEATPEKASACIAAVVAELPKIKGADYFTDEEMKNAAHRIEVERAQERLTTSGRSHALTFVWGSASLDYDGTYQTNIRAITRSDIGVYLDRWILGKPFVLGAMTSQKAIEAGVTKETLEKAAGIGKEPKPPETHAVRALHEGSVEAGGRVVSQ